MRIHSLFSIFKLQVLYLLLKNWKGKQDFFLNDERDITQIFIWKKYKKYLLSLKAWNWSINFYSAILKLLSLEMITFSKNMQTPTLVDNLFAGTAGFPMIYNVYKDWATTPPDGAIVPYASNE